MQAENDVQGEGRIGDVDTPTGPLGMLSNLLAAIGTIWIFALMFLVVADVAGRNLFDAPITGVAEIAGHSVIAIVFLQISLAVLGERLTTADFLVNRLRRRLPLLMLALEIAFMSVGALVFAAIVYASWADTADAWRTGEFFGVQGVFTVPVFPFRAIMVLGSTVAVAAYLAVIIRKISDFRGQPQS